MINRFSWEKFNKIPIVGIVRGLTFDEVKNILPVYQSSGLNTIEITMNTPDAGKIIRYISENYTENINVGAGTVCTLPELEIALEAGAGFVVTPVIEDAVIESCVKSGIPVFPGAFTPTEIFRAWKLGANMIKLFPANSLGTAYIKDVKAPLGHVKLLPTGGINLSNCLEFLRAGASGLGIGSQLFDKKMISDKNWKTLEEHFSMYAQKVGSYTER